MTKVLLVARRDRDTEWAVNFLVKMQRTGPIETVLLSVQTPFDGHVHQFFAAEDIHAFHLEDARAELEPVEKAMKRAGLPFDGPYVRVGYSAQTIAQFAHLQHCGQIVLGPLRDRTGIADRILGSLPRQIARLMEVAGEPCEVL